MVLFYVVYYGFDGLQVIVQCIVGLCSQLEQGLWVFGYLLELVDCFDIVIVYCVLVLVVYCVVVVVGFNLWVMFDGVVLVDVIGFGISFDEFLD